MTKKQMLTNFEKLKRNYIYKFNIQITVKKIRKLFRENYPKSPKCSLIFSPKRKKKHMYISRFGKKKSR